MLVHEPDAEFVRADLGPAAPHPDYQVGARVHRREALDPDMLEDSQYAQLAVLVDERVVGQDCEVDLQLSSP
jgi:hypothetical protein